MMDRIQDVGQRLNTCLNEWNPLGAYPAVAVASSGILLRLAQSIFQDMGEQLAPWTGLASGLSAGLGGLLPSRIYTASAGIASGFEQGSRYLADALSPTSRALIAMSMTLPAVISMGRNILCGDTDKDVGARIREQLSSTSARFVATTAVLTSIVASRNILFDSLAPSASVITLFDLGTIAGAMGYAYQANQGTGNTWTALGSFTATVITTVVVSCLSLEADGRDLDTVTAGVGISSVLVLSSLVSQVGLLVALNSKWAADKMCHFSLKGIQFLQDPRGSKAAQAAQENLEQEIQQLTHKLSSNLLPREANTSVTPILKRVVELMNDNSEVIEWNAFIALLQQLQPEADRQISELSTQVRWRIYENEESPRPSIAKAAIEKYKELVELKKEIYQTGTVEQKERSKAFQDAIDTFKVDDEKLKDDLDKFNKVLVACERTIGLQREEMQRYADELWKEKLYDNSDCLGCASRLVALAIDSEAKEIIHPFYQQVLDKWEKAAETVYQKAKNAYENELPANDAEIKTWREFAFSLKNFAFSLDMMLRHFDLHFRVEENRTPQQNRIIEVVKGKRDEIRKWLNVAKRHETVRRSQELDKMFSFIESNADLDELTLRIEDIEKEIKLMEGMNEVFDEINEENKLLQQNAVRETRERLSKLQRLVEGKSSGNHSLTSFEVG